MLDGKYEIEGRQAQRLPDPDHPVDFICSVFSPLDQSSLNERMCGGRRALRVLEMRFPSFSHTEAGTIYLKSPRNDNSRYAGRLLSLMMLTTEGVFAPRLDAMLTPRRASRPTFFTKTHSRKNLCRQSPANSPKPSR